MRNFFSSMTVHCTLTVFTLLEKKTIKRKFDTFSGFPRCQMDKKIPKRGKKSPLLFKFFLNQNRSSKESKVCSSFSFVLFLPLVPSLYKCQILHQETVKIPEHLSSNLYSHKFLWNFRFSIHYLHCVSYTRKQK
uniref:Uncharacterized protein n=1 Tax=Cacopsylla melanoneura TaxID=428564 RepID=A0A8D8VDB7_9HEMI